MTEENKHICTSVGGGGAHFSANSNAHTAHTTTSAASSNQSKQHNQNSQGNQQAASGQQPQASGTRLTNREKKRLNQKRPGQTITAPSNKPRQTPTSSSSTNPASMQQAPASATRQKKGRNKRGGQGGGYMMRESLAMAGGGSVQDYSYLLGFQTKDIDDPMQNDADFAKRRRRQRGQSQHQPAFTKEQFMQAAFKFIVKPLRKQTQLLKKAKSAMSEKEVLKEEKRVTIAQEQESRYGGYLNNPGAIVDWKDVIEVVYTMPTALTGQAQKTQCPICMEPAGFMVAPRVTKCGHLFCYACLLQYLDYEATYAWKKCPLCAESIYKRDIRKASIVFDQSEQDVAEVQKQKSLDILAQSIQFRLTVRNKSNTIQKRKIWLPQIDGDYNSSEVASKQENQEESKTQISMEPQLLKSMTILEGHLPTAEQADYAGSRVRVGSEAYIRSLLSHDLEQLKRDRTQKAAINEEDQVYYLDDAIAFCEGQLELQEGELTQLAGHFEEGEQAESDSEQMDTYIDPKQLNKQMSLKKQASIASTKEAVIAENSDTCFYFYQAVNGENLYLHPLCMEILNYDRQLRLEQRVAEQTKHFSAADDNNTDNDENLIELPTLVSGKVIEMSSGGMNLNGHAAQCDFLGHLPPAASYLLVEIDLSATVCQQALSKYSKQLQERQKVRATKAVKEKRYNDRVEKTNTKKFNEMKEQVLEDAGLLVRRPSQPIIGYLHAQIAEEEKKGGQQAPAKKEPVGFIGLDDDDDHGLERVFSSFKRKGQGGDSAYDRGGGTASTVNNSLQGLPNAMGQQQDPVNIWALGGLQELQNQAQGFRMDAALFDQAKGKPMTMFQSRQQRVLSDGSEGMGIQETAAQLGFGVQVETKGGGGKGGRKKKFKKVVE